ncbi:MAG: phosphate signaling complex protein PhoU [Treponema sp.]|jgi:phosphate transport system protein|nr:phosphate signaling complex protein PhoU [Treponema sp.]
MNIRLIFSEEMDRLRYDILIMASRVEEDLGKALAALRNNDKILAKEVRRDDDLINAMQLKIEEDAAALIATQHPVAGDMRELVTVFKITANLERAGDHAVHLAKTAAKLSGNAPFRQEEHLEQMVKTGQAMIRAAVSAYLAKDAEAARKAAAMDDAIDAEHRALTEETLRLMKEHPELIKKAVRLLNTSGNLERLGDHITNICEAVVYMVESKHEELNE